MSKLYYNASSGDLVEWRSADSVFSDFEGEAWFEVGDEDELMWLFSMHGLRVRSVAVLRKLGFTYIGEV